MKHGGKFLALIAMLFLVCFSVSALETETKANSVVSNLGLYGGQPDGMAMEYGTDNLCLAYNAADGLYCSNDAAASFNNSLTGSNIGVGKTVEFDQGTGYVYALIGDALLKSEDSGASFTDITTNVGSANFGNSIAIGDDRVIVAMQEGVVAISTDNGASWLSATVDSGYSITSIAASPTSGYYYAVLDNGNDDKLYQSTDGGFNWVDMQVHDNGVAAGSEFYRVYVDPLDGSHIAFSSSVSGHYNYQTLDGGLNWEAITVNSEGINSNYIAFDGAGRMYTASYYSDDNFTTASELERTTPLSFIYFDLLLVDRDDNNILYSNSGLGLAKSIDGGQTWTDNVDGVTAVKTYDITQSNNKQVVWIGANGGLGRTTNYKSSNPAWTYPILADQSITTYEAVWIYPGDSDKVVVGGGTSIFISSNANDDEPTWSQAITPAFSGGGVKDIINDPDDYDHLFAVIYNDDLTGDDTGAVWESTDAGNTWTDLAITDDATANSITINSSGALYVGLVGDINTLGVYKYTSSAGWTKPSTDLDDCAVTSILVDPEDDDVIYATIQGEGNKEGFYKSTDAGKNWSRISQGIEDINWLNALTVQTSSSTNKLYMAGQNNNTLNGVIYKSEDAGESWDLFYTGLKQESFYTLLYDGLMWGNDRGMFEGKTRAVIKVTNKKPRVKKGKKSKIYYTLKDKVTGTKLKNKKLKIYKKIGKKKYKFWKTKKTNKKGKVKIAMVIKKTTRFKAKWVPKNNLAEEYASVTSKTKRIKIKK